jgi:methylated-DNA-[protein]-cysteine S-methyltransferase
MTSQKPLLHIQIDYSEGVVQAVHLTPSSTKGIEWTFQSSSVDSKLEKCVNQWFEAYLQKKTPSIQVPLALNTLPLFTQQVLRAIAKIPFGMISTYGQIATLLGRPQAARAVGGACGRNPFLLFIPCHRVLDAKKELRGFSAGGISVKHSLLTFEGVDFHSP